MQYCSKCFLSILTLPNAAHPSSSLMFSPAFRWALAQRALQVLPAGLVPVLVPVLVPGQALTARKRIGTYEYQVEVWEKNRKKKRTRQADESLLILC